MLWENRKNIVSLWNMPNYAIEVLLEWEYEGVFNINRMFMTTYSLLEELVILSVVFCEEISQNDGT